MFKVNMTLYSKKVISPYQASHEYTETVKDSDGKPMTNQDILGYTYCKGWSSSRNRLRTKTEIIRIDKTRISANKNI